MKFLLLGLIPFLFSCKKEIRTDIKIVEENTTLLKTLDGEKIKFPEGETKGLFVLDSNYPTRSFLELDVLRENREERPVIPMRLPHIDVLLGSTDPVRVESKTIGQNFGMIVMRQMRTGDDLFTVSFHDKDFNNSFGHMTFEYEPEKVHFDEDNKQFLASYQKVIRKQRATIIKVDSELDDMMSLSNSFGWLEKTLDHIVNFGGATLISPWAYARYSKVKWLIGDSAELKDSKDIEDVLNIVKDYPVIDYFAFVHGGNQHLNLSPEELGLKKNQLRVAYTGACSSGPGQEWLKNYGAVAAAGTLGTSASPLFQFSVMRKFVYGFNFEDALVKSYKAGVLRARVLGWITFSKLWEEKNGVLLWKNLDDMITQSEILFSYTKELPAKEVQISNSAILSKTPYENDIVLSRATNPSEVREEAYADLDESLSHY